MAEKIRKELGIEVDEVSGHYGEFTVLVDGQTVRQGNPVAVMFAMVPAADEVIAALRARLKGGSQ